MSEKELEKLREQYNQCERKKSTKMITMSTRVPESIELKILKKAIDEDKTKTDVIREILERCLRNGE